MTVNDVIIDEQPWRLYFTLGLECYHNPKMTTFLTPEFIAGYESIFVLTSPTMAEMENMRPLFDHVDFDALVKAVNLGSDGCFILSKHDLWDIKSLIAEALENDVIQMFDLKEGE
jgi:hypothetical protein